MGKLPIAAVAALALLIAMPGGAQQPPPPPIPPPPPAASAAPPLAAPPSDEAGRVTRPTQVSPSGPPIVLQANKGTLIRLPAAANTVFVANSGIADVTIKTPTLIYVSAQTPGETTLYAVDAEDHVLLSSVVRVEPNLTPMREAVELLKHQQRASLEQLRGAGIGENVRVNWMDKTLVLGGTVSSLREAEAVRAAATAIVGGVPGSTVLDRLMIATPNQVNIRVKFAEVDRTVTKALGIDLSKLTGQAFTFNTNLPLAVGGSVLQGKIPGSNNTNPVEALISVLAQEGYVKTLAEPNLTVANNETAVFNAGGKFFPLITNPGGIGNALGPEQDFGTTLSVTPTILDAGHIKLQISPNVSNQPVSAAGGTLETATFAKTTVELGSGDTFALAGLIQDKSSLNVQKVPGLGDLPYVGQMFRSENYTKSEVELVILVTPYLVEPSRTALAAPTDQHQWPHDAQQVIDGSMYRQRLPGAQRVPVGGSVSGPVGPVGFRLD